MDKKSFGYPDLQDPQEVFKGLLGQGLFFDKLPPCFDSSELINFSTPETRSKETHSAISYFSTRNTNISRQFSIPHPEAYWNLCSNICKFWDKINLHIGEPDIKFNYCHVRKKQKTGKIFEMNYTGIDKHVQEELVHDYSIGCSVVVKLDISTCFPSIYTHSIPWAIQGKAQAKVYRSSDIKNKYYHWSNELDLFSRKCNDDQTNGLLIGPHASNIISEIILTKVDSSLQETSARYKRIVRNIDDYLYFAIDESDARAFTMDLEQELKKYELLLNQKKTITLPLLDYFEDSWPAKLSRFPFPSRENIGFPTINNYINLSLTLAKQTGNFAAVNYAMKVISKKSLSPRAIKLYTKKILSITYLHPYLMPLLESCLFHFLDIKVKSFKDDFSRFLNSCLSRSLKFGLTDSISFIFYFAVKYEITLQIENDWKTKVINFGDCISTLLAWKYSRENNLCDKKFIERVKEIRDSGKREQDKFWLLIYEYAAFDSTILDEQNYLKRLHEEKVSFFNLKVAEL